jgi:hypothetical protein
VAGNDADAHKRILAARKRLMNMRFTPLRAYEHVKPDMALPCASSADCISKALTTESVRKQAQTGTRTLGGESRQAKER